MDMAHILEQLKAERAQIEEAIISLERLARSRGPRRGRPPAWLSQQQHSDTQPAEAKRRGRPPKQKPEMAASAAAGQTSAA
jgi:hypothetical protein